MKKVGIVVLLVAFSLGLFFFFQGTVGKRVEAADCLPDDVLFYGEQLEFIEMYQSFMGSRLGRTLSRLDYPGIAAELGASEEKIQQVEESWRNVSKILADPGLNELLGKEFSVAVFPASSFSEENSVRAIEKSLLLIARPRHSTKLLQLLAPFLSEDIQQSTIQYGKHTITRYQIDAQNTLATASIAGLVLAGFEERLVRKSLDIYDNQKDTLSDNKDFQKLRRHLQGKQLFCYFSFPALLDQGRMIGKNLPDEDRSEFLALLEQWKGLRAAAYGAWREKGLVKDKFEILFDQKKLDGQLAMHSGVKPGENQTLQLVPRDVFLYYWANTLNLPFLWELYSSNAPQQKPEAFVLLQRELRDSAGVELEEVLAMIGNEFGVIMEDVDREGIPLPKATIFIQLKEPEKFLKVFNVLLKNADIPVTQKQYQGQDITYWGVSPQGGLQPAFALMDNYLFISNSLDLVQQIADLKTDPSQNLSNSPAMKVVGGHFTEDNNSATYIHIAKLADSLKSIAIWTGGMAALQGPEIARNVDIVINQLVLPFLDGVAMYTQLGSRSFITDESIVVESTTIIVP